MTVQIANLYEWFRRNIDVVGRVLFLLTFLLGFLVRINHLDAQSFWEDELRTIVHAQSIDNTVALGARYTLYSLGIHLWMSISDSDFFLRYSSVLASMVTIPLVWQIGKKFGEIRTALYLTSMIAIFPIAVAHAQDLRMYSLMAALGMAVLWLATRLERKGQSIRICFLLAIFFMTLVHVLSVLFCITVLIVLAIRRVVTVTEHPAWGELLLAGGTIVLTLASITIVDIIHPVNSLWELAGGLNWIPQPGYYDLGDFVLTGLGFRARTPGYYMILNWAAFRYSLLIGGILVALALASLLSAMGKIRQARWDEFWGGGLLLALAVVPPAALYVTSYLYRPVWHLRYLLPSLICSVMFVAWGLSRIGAMHLRRIGICVLFVISMSTAWRLTEDSTYYRPDLRGGLHYVDMNADKEDTLLYCGMYFLDGMGHYRLSNDLSYLNIEAYFLGAEQLSRLRDTELHTSVWLIYRGERCYNIHDDAAHYLGTLTMVETTEFHGVTVKQYSTK